MVNIDPIHGKLKQAAIPYKKAAEKLPDALTPEQAAWEQIYTDLDIAIKVRHYSPKTYKPMLAGSGGSRSSPIRKPRER